MKSVWSIINLGSAVDEKQTQEDDIKGIVMTQKTSQCCRVLCCQPNIDWTVTPWTEEIETLGSDWSGSGVGSHVAYSSPYARVEEDAPWAGRCYSCLAPGSRATTLRYYDAEKNDHVMMSHSKGCTNGQNQFLCPGENGNNLRMPCCCFLPYMNSYDANGTLVGTSRYECDACLFVPKYSIYSTTGQPWWVVRPDTCLCGCCVHCQCCDGSRKARCFRVPYYVRDPVTWEKVDQGNAKFVDLWSGWEAECCTKRDVFEVKFPQNATPSQKTALVGCAHLIDITIIEQRGN